MKETIWRFLEKTMIRKRVVKSKVFDCNVTEERARIIHPIVLIITIWYFFYCLFNWWIKEFISDVKNNICIY